jgi:hypothetical protein
MELLQKINPMHVFQSGPAKALFVIGLVLIGFGEVVNGNYVIGHPLLVLSGILTLFINAYLANCMVMGNCTYIAWGYAVMLLAFFLLAFIINLFVGKLQKKK